MGEIEAHLARGLHRVLRDVRWFPNSCPGPRTQVATLSSLNGESLPWVQAPFTPCSHRLDGELVDMGPEGTGGNPGVQVRGGDQKLEPEQCCLPRGGDRTSEVRAASQTPLPGGESKWSEWCLRSWLSHPWDGASSPDPLLAAGSVSGDLSRSGGFGEPCVVSVEQAGTGVLEEVGLGLSYHPAGHYPRGSPAGGRERASAWSSELRASANRPSATHLGRTRASPALAHGRPPPRGVYADAAHAPPRSCPCSLCGGGMEEGKGGDFLTLPVPKKCPFF